MTNDTRTNLFDVLAIQLETSLRIVRAMAAEERGDIKVVVPLVAHPNPEICEHPESVRKSIVAMGDKQTDMCGMCGTNFVVGG